MSRSSILVVLLAAVAVVGCSRTEPVHDVTSAPVVAKSGSASATQVHDVIIQALQQNGWYVLQDDPGTIVAETVVNERHRATIRIDHSATQYSITYQDSDLLLYDGEEIHRNYNAWIKRLEEQINQDLSEV